MRLGRTFRTVALLVSSAVPAAARSPSTYPVEIHDDDDGGCWFLGDRLIKLGSWIPFMNESAAPRLVEQRQGSWSFTIPQDAIRKRALHAAGTYAATCDGGNAAVVARVKVRTLAEPPSPDFQVTWADAEAGGTWTYDVQYRIGDRGWRAWKRGTSVRSLVFDGAKGKTYRFRARVTKPGGNGGTTPWSPARLVST